MGLIKRKFKKLTATISAKPTAPAGDSQVAAGVSQADAGISQATPNTPQAAADIPNVSQAQADFAQTSDAPQAAAVDSLTKTTEPGGMRAFDLIITIVNRGFSDLALEASKTAGAKGGTVLHARGTGVHEVERFFSISIQPEKEVILSLVRHKAAKEVMHAIIEAAGLQTEGKGLCFSLPVDEVTGIARWLAADGSEADPPAPATRPPQDSGKKKK